jgi:hypothetical protein
VLIPVVEIEKAKTVFEQIKNEKPGHAGKHKKK